eukprot:2644214-Pleurochrysis_carterae.AAC.3
MRRVQFGLTKFCSPVGCEPFVFVDQRAAVPAATKIICRYCCPLERATTLRLGLRRLRRCCRYCVAAQVPVALAETRGARDRCAGCTRARAFPR